MTHVEGSLGALVTTAYLQMQGELRRAGPYSKLKAERLHHDRDQLV